MDAVTFAIAILATWRVASLVVNEDGPFRMFKRIRELVGITHGPDGMPEMIPSGFWPSLFSCIWCASVWVGALLTGLWLILPLVFVKVTLFLALSAAAILIEKAVRHP